MVSEPVASSAPEVRPRRPLPGGRAVTGALLVATSLVGIVAAHARATADHGLSFVVAATTVPAGTVLDASHLATARMELPPTLARTRAFRSARPLVGATVLSPLGAGELIQASAVVRRSGAPQELELSVPVLRAAALGGDLQPGEETLASAWQRRPTDAEVGPYWLAVVELNRPRLADRDNPDLVFAGQEMALPPVPHAPGLAP